jgi:hypothetical protein
MNSIDEAFCLFDASINAEQAMAEASRIRQKCREKVSLGYQVLMPIESAHRCVQIALARY